MDNKDKKPNVIAYTISMLVLFVILIELVIMGVASSLIAQSVIPEPGGTLVISEAILASLVLIVMLAYGNSYVFTQKKEKVTKGLFYACFILLEVLHSFYLYHVKE